VEIGVDVREAHQRDLRSVELRRGADLAGHLLVEEAPGGTGQPQAELTARLGGERRREAGGMVEGQPPGLGLRRRNGDESRAVDLAPDRARSPVEPFVVRRVHALAGQDADAAPLTAELDLAAPADVEGLLEELLVA